MAKQKRKGKIGIVILCIVLSISFLGVTSVLFADNSSGGSSSNTNSVAATVKVDQVYSPNSKNPQSGVAVLQAISGANKYTDAEIEKLQQSEVLIDHKYDAKSENAQSGKAVAEALDGISAVLPAVETSFINYREQVVIQGTSKYLFDDYIIESPEVGVPYSISVKSIENSPINQIQIQYLDASGKVILKQSKNGTTNLRLTLTCPVGAASVKLTCYATSSGGLSETPAVFHDVYIFKGYEMKTDIPAVTISKVESETISKMLPSLTVKSIVHRGNCNRYVTQNSRSAYIESRKMGYTCAENDLMITADGVFVMQHEPTMARHGSYIEDITGKRLYADANGVWYWCNINVSPQEVYTFDYNNEVYVKSDVAFSSLTVVSPSSVAIKDTEYKVLKRMNMGKPEGNLEQIMTFSEWILLMKQLGMEAYIDIKKTTPPEEPAFTDEQWAELVGTVRKFGMLKHVTWLVSWGEWDILRSLDPSARFGITATLNEAHIEMLSSYTQGGEVIYYGTTEELTQQIADKVRECGLVLECWYVGYASTPEEEKLVQINKAFELGVEAIALDYVRIESLFING